MKPTGIFECDLHVHSIRSTCGFHTLLEIVSIIRNRGLRGFALTDHGPALDTPRAHFSVLLRRIPRVIDGIRVFKGIEASVMSAGGELDLPEFPGYRYEAILAGLHPHDAFASSPGKEINTRALVNAMRNYPALKIITHPYYSTLPVDFDELTDVATETGTALEINNSHLKMDKVNLDWLSEMLDHARRKGTPLAVNSDGHVFTEMGDFALAAAFLEPFGPDSLTIVNRTLESTAEFLGVDAAG
ncbi:hypothetical protein LLG96_18560 [bacterium]|nr:hypothetical protein [bacterium]